MATYAAELELTHELREVLGRAPSSPWIEAAIALVEGDTERAATIYAEIGDVTSEACVRMRAAERLIALGRRAEGEAKLEKAMAFYRTVGATYYLARAESLLAKSA